MKSLISNLIRQLTKLLTRKKILYKKWVYRAKENHDGSKRYEVYIVVKGFYHKEGVVYTRIFPPVVKHNNIRYVLSMVTNEEFYLEQSDMKTPFIHENFVEEIYMHKSEGL